MEGKVDLVADMARVHAVQRHAGDVGEQVAIFMHAGVVRRGGCGGPAQRGLRIVFSKTLFPVRLHPERGARRA